MFIEKVVVVVGVDFGKGVGGDVVKCNGGIGKCGVWCKLVFWCDVEGDGEW